MTKKDKLKKTVQPVSSEEIKHNVTAEEIKDNGLEAVLKPGNEITIPPPKKVKSAPTPKITSKPHWVDQTLWDSLTEAQRVKLCAGTPVGEL